MGKKLLILTVLAVLSVLMLAACGAADAPEEVPAATPEIVETPAPTPTPTPEPEIPAGMAVTVDGKPLESGSVVKDGTVYVKLDEFTAALDSESVTDGESVSFVWRRRDVGMDTGSAALSYGERRRSSPPLQPFTAVRYGYRSSPRAMRWRYPPSTTRSTTVSTALPARETGS